MQNIIMIKQSDVLSGCQLQTLIGISRNSFVFQKLVIHDASICFGFIFLYHLCDISMCIIRAVCQTQFPVRIGLIHHRIDHFPQEFLGRIKQRHQNTDLHSPRKVCILLRFPPCPVRKALRSELLHGMLLTFLVFDLGNNPFDRAAILHSGCLTDAPVHTLSGRCRGFPDRIALNPVQFKIQIIHLRFQICHTSGKIGIPQMLFFICLLIVHFFLTHSSGPFSISLSVKQFHISLLFSFLFH